MRVRHPRLWLLPLPLLIFSCTSLAAYVQTHNCPNRGGDLGGGPFSIGALMTSASDANSEPKPNRLTLVFSSGGQFNRTECESILHPNLTSVVRIASLGSTAIYNGVFESSYCANFTKQSIVYPRIKFTYDIPPPQFLDTYWLTAELQNNSSLSGCLNAYLTPNVGVLVSRIATWAPVIVFALVLLSGLWKEVRQLSVNHNSSAAAKPGREPSRSHVIRISDCISYLQFVFFSGALTLSYPGFLQPVVSHMHWSTLMFPVGVVARQPWYDGVRDGIHVLNGTFGGTEGLALMTQVTGGTITVDTWLNIIALAALVFVLILAVILQGRRLIRGHNFFGNRPTSASYPVGEVASTKTSVLSALRLFFSYLLLPLVAWTTYLLTYAYYFPLYYTAAASFLDVSLVALISVSMWRSSPHRMGYLLVDSIQRSNSMSHEWRDLYAVNVFALLLLRGIAIGGLQMVGLAQLLVLLSTEIVHLAFFAIAYCENPLASQTGRMPALRIIILLLEFGFLPGVAGFSTRIVLGYAVLLVHVLVLIFFFLLPGIHDIYALLTNTSMAPPPSLAEDGKDMHRPPVFTLRQIMKRPSRETTPGPPNWNDDALQSQATSPAPAHTSRRTASVNSKDSFYFRSPRLNSTTEFYRASCSTLHSSFSLTGSSSPTGSSQSDASSINIGSPEEQHLGNAIQIPCPPPHINPNIDYSFREADLYYFQPRTKLFGKDNDEQTKTLTGGLQRIRVPFSFGK